MAGPEDMSREELLAELVRAMTALADHELRARAVHDELLVRCETAESHARTVEETLDWYIDLYEFAPTPYLALDGAGVIREINLVGATLLGLERERLIDRPLRLHVPPRERRAFLDHMLRCRQTRELVTSEVTLSVAGGREIPVQLLSRRAQIVGGRGQLFRTAVLDLSQHRRDQEELRLGAQRLELALAASGAGLFEYTWPERQLTPTERWAELLGRPRTSLPAGLSLWRWFVDRIAPEDRAARRRAQIACLTGAAGRYTAEFRVWREDGKTRWLRELAQVAQREEGRMRVVGVLVDITAERERLAQAERQAEQMRELTAKLYEVEESERRELAQHLHDDLGQRLVAAKLKLGPLLEGGPPALREIAEILDETQVAVRSMTFQLSPPILRDLGLVAGLRWLARELEGQYGLRVAVEDDGPLPPLAAEPMLLYRCVRELLLNVVRHGATDAATVTLATLASPTHVLVTVADQGAGFEPAQLAAERLEHRSFGLLSVQERIERLGGEVRIDSAPNAGTRVQLRIPRPPRERRE